MFVFLLASSVVSASPLFSGNAESNVIRVPSDYPTIQEAIDSASPGSMILVSSGTYHEHLMVNKTLSLLGTDRTHTIIDADNGTTAITVTADNVLINGFTVQNSSMENAGIHVDHSNNCTISDNNITLNGQYGIFLDYSNSTTVQDNIVSSTGGYLPDLGLIWGIGIGLGNSCNDTISDNIITSSVLYGIYVADSNSNLVQGNVVEDNQVAGIMLSYSNMNVIYHNDFINNQPQLPVAPGTQAFQRYSQNIWDDGYPSGGNYWSDYNGTDSFSGPYQNETGSDGIGDVPYENVSLIAYSNNITDRYPLMGPFSAFDAGIWNGIACEVDATSNSTISDFQVDIAHGMVSLNVTGPQSTYGFCRLAIPNTIVQGLWHGNYTVLLNDEPWPFENWTDATNTYIYINYTQSRHGVIIVPEYPWITTLALFAGLSALAVALSVKRKPRKLNLSEL
jgi:parallel beta-helix repeat protein